MDTPFTKAAKRGEVFFEEPMMLAFPSQISRCSTYSRQITPVCAREPASASPKPSRRDFLPSSTTSCGMSSYFVDAINFPTYSVSPGAFAKSPPTGGSAPFADRRHALQSGNIAHWIAETANDTPEFSSLDGADIRPPSHHLRLHDRRGANHLRRTHSEFNHVAELFCLSAVRKRPHTRPKTNLHTCRNGTPKTRLANFSNRMAPVLPRIMSPVQLVILHPRHHVNALGPQLLHVPLTTFHPS